MENHLDLEIENSMARYNVSLEEGRRVIRSRWRALQAVTRAALMASSVYSDHGERLGIESETSQLQNDFERLEHALGVLKQCAVSKLPLRTEKGALIPREATDDDVISSCELLLIVPAWHDPEFLRLALNAVVIYELANALSMIGPPASKSVPMGCLGATVQISLLLLLPAFLAGGIAAAVSQDVGTSALAFYVVAAGVLAAMSIAGVRVNKASGFEQAHAAWTSFQVNRTVGIVGVGAMEHLKRMIADGITVPSVTLDLAEALRCRTVIHESSGSP